jgi:hypothetical protein
MELKWRWDASGAELNLVTPGRGYRHGYIEVFETESVYNYEFKKKHTYTVHVLVNLSAEMMHCEEVEYVSLRKAMRALKETVTVLLIGRGYGL